MNNIYVSDTMLGAGDAAVNKKTQVTFLVGLLFRNIPGASLGGSVGKNPPASGGDTGLTPDLRRSHVMRSK